MPGLEPRRADLVVAGSVLLDTILRQLGADDITLCDLALREGLILDYVHRNRTEIARADRYPDVRRRSVVELAERCHYWPEHASQVARISLALFDQTRGVHGLTDRERQWLEYAALLHDIGVHISYEKHHRHSYYLIKHGDLRGFDPQEIEVMALVARYHRRATPKKGHPGYTELPPALRKVVKVLAACVRLAEGLDRSHAQVHRLGEPARPRARVRAAAAHLRRRRARALVRRPARRGLRGDGRQARPLRGRGGPGQENPGRRDDSRRFAAMTGRHPQIPQISADSAYVDAAPLWFTAETVARHARRSA